MQNISQSLPKRSFISSSNGGFTTTHKSVYDDVFGGAKKNELPTLAPRLEDYTEIFGGFHASRSCSIPVLDIPVIDDELELHFDYAEVFGGSRGVNWAPYYEEVVRECSGIDDDSDELWSPAQSGSMSNEVDLSAGSDRSYGQSGGDAHQLEGNMQFDVSFNKSNQNMKSVETDQIRGANVSSTPEYSCSHSETSVTWSGDDEYCNPYATDNNKCSQYFDERTLVENRIYSSEKHGSWTCPLVRPFMNVSDISLRTKPSRLPPPSRPPPPLAVKRGEFGRSNSNHKVYKNHAFESDADESDKLFLDVEVDVASSADDFDKKWILEDVTKVGEKVNEEVGSNRSFKRDRVIQSDREKTRVSISSVEDEIRSRKAREEFSEPLGKQNFNHIADNSARPVAWREEPDFYEVVEKNMSSDPFETVEEQSNIMQFQNPREGYGSFKIIDSEAFEQNEKRRKSKSTTGAPTWSMKMNEHKMARDDCHWVNNQQRKKMQKKSGQRNDFEDKVTLKKLAGVHSFNRITPDLTEQPGKSGKLIGHVGYLNREVATECNQNEVEPELNISASSKKIEVDKKFIHAVRMKENSEKEEEKIVREEYHKRIEDVGRAEIRERLKETIEQEGTEKQPFGVYWKENEDKVKESQVLKENEMIAGDVHRHGESSKKSCTVVGHGEISKNIKEDVMLSAEVHIGNERLINFDKSKLSKLTSGMGFQHYGNKKEREVTPEVTVIKEKGRDASVREPNDLSVTKPESESSYDGEIRKTKVNLDLRQDACAPELLGDAEKMNPFESHGNGRKIRWDAENDVLIQSDQLKVFERTTSGFFGNNNNPLFVEKPRTSFSHNVLKPQFSFSANESEAGMLDSIVSECKFNRFGKDKDEVQDGETCIVLNNAGERSSLPKQMLGSKTGGNSRVSKSVMPEKTVDKEIYMENDVEQKLRGAQFIIKEVDIKDSFTSCLLAKESVVNGKKWEDVSSKQSIERNHNDIKENLVMKDPKVGERIRRDIELENDQIIKVDKEKERENAHSRKSQEEKEKERENEQIRKREKERRWENEQMRKREEEREREIEQIRKREEEKERENERMRKQEEEKERENERMRKQEEEKERERGRKMEKEQMRKREEEKKRENELMRKQEEEKEREREKERMRKREEEKERVMEIERMRKREQEKEREKENEQIRKREEEREREREREKDMMAVDKAAFEAHERSYVEARERVERANTEARQRAIPVARETSVDTRRRVERAAVERATAEARQRAVEQSMTEKFAVNRVGKSVSDRFSTSYRSADTNNSSLSSDNQFKNTGISSGLGHAYGSPHVGAGGESPQRCKARLDRYKRTAERAANALAEKNRRDLLVQKEKEERNRVADTLDAEVRRWSSGKEGNLRALLSTLQYILGQESGWQPVPLTEVITSAAVKKSYRKATLCVHPDKLQQRGASIQQKYLCEKVFDLLKEAWSKFNSEER